MSEQDSAFGPRSPPQRNGSSRLAAFESTCTRASRIACTQPAGTFPSGACSTPPYIHLASLMGNPKYLSWLFSRYGLSLPPQSMPEFWLSEFEGHPSQSFRGKYCSNWPSACSYARVTLQGYQTRSSKPTDLIYSPRRLFRRTLWFWMHC